MPGLTSSIPPNPRLPKFAPPQWPRVRAHRARPRPVWRNGFGYDKSCRVTQRQGFSWASVAASAVSAPLTQGILGKGGLNITNPVAQAAVGSLVSATTRVAIVGGKLNWQAVAADTLTALAVQGLSGGNGSAATQPNTMLAEQDAQAKLGTSVDDWSFANDVAQRRAQQFNGIDIADTSGSTNYTVQKGDSLARIAREQYGSERALATLMADNGLTSTTLQPGQSLMIRSDGGVSISDQSLHAGGDFIAWDSAGRAAEKAAMQETAAQISTAYNTAAYDPSNPNAGYRLHNADGSQMSLVETQRLIAAADAAPRGSGMSVGDILSQRTTNADLERYGVNPNTVSGQITTHILAAGESVIDTVRGLPALFDGKTWSAIGTGVYNLATDPGGVGIRLRDSYDRMQATNDYMGLARFDVTAAQVVFGAAGAIKGSVGALEGFAARQATAANYYGATGWSNEKIAAHLEGIDFSQPVDVITLPQGTQVVQHQIPGNPIGGYFAPVGTPAEAVGINPVGRTPAIYTTTGDVSVLRSTAADTTLNSNVPSSARGTGGGTQYFSADRLPFSPGQ